MDNVNLSEDIYNKLNSSAQGLSQEEAQNRLLNSGPNEINTQNKKHIIIEFLSKFLSPLIITLILVALVSIFLGEKINSAIIIAMVFLSVILSFIQEYNASKIADKLKSLVRVTVRVLRDGQKQDLPLREIVPGDIIDLSVGKIVPADIQIIKAKDLYINQSALNGESFPAKKESEGEKSQSLYDTPYLAFMGSSVSSGVGEAIVLKTGKNTEFGKLSSETLKKEDTTSFEKGITSFTWLMIKFTFILVFFIFIINALFKHNLIESLLFSLAVAIGLTPEMLPMLVTVNLSKGAREMAKRKVIVKELASIQNFGAMDILCTDKTGTLTLNEIVLIKHADINGHENDEILRLAYLNSSLQSGLDNLLDKAVIKHKKFDLELSQKKDEIPFDFERRIMSVVVDENSKIKLISKGSPEAILDRSNQYSTDNQIKPIDGEIKLKLQKQFNDFSQEGFRVLAVAYKDIETKTSYEVEDEKDLIFVGFIAFLDPPKPEAEAAVKKMADLGISLKVLSGDNELVTRKICEDLKIKISQVLNGDKIDTLDDQQLQLEAEKSNIFTRLNPIQKERIISALQNSNHTVGFLGDGINDAPSLKTAFVGISVDNATDIAKETAEIILLEKDLRVLADCVAEGRKTFANIIKCIKMESSSNFGNMLSMTIASLFLPFLPMLPPQILLNNFLYDVSQVAVPTDNVDGNYLKKPKPWNIKFIKEFMLIIGPVSSIFDFATFGVMWYIFHANPELFRSGWFIESLVTQSLVVYIIRTNKIPFLQSKPSKMLFYSILAIVMIGVLIPFTGLGKIFGFSPLPFTFFIILLVLALCYLLLVQFVKSWFIKKYGYE